MSELLEASVLQALLDAATDSLLALDANGRIVTANIAASALLGVPEGAIEGRPLEELLPPVARRPLTELLRRGEGTIDTFVATGRAELQLRTLDDGGFVVRLRSQPSRAGWAANDTALRDFLVYLPYGVVSVDVGGNVEFANPQAKALFHPAWLRRGSPIPEPWPELSLAGLLERTRRTRATGPPRIIDSGRRTLRVVAVSLPRDESPLLIVEDVTRDHARSRIYTDFVRNAAHQLRTPAAAIASAVEVLQGGAKENSADRDRFLAHVERETHRLIRLTQALLVLARANAGVQAPRLEFVPLEPLLRDALGSTAPSSVELTCDPAVAVFVQRDLTEQAFQALVDNAVRHSRAGPVTIAAEDAGGGRVTVTIHNDGDAIRPEQLERIHEPFFRGSFDDDGFGLGLAIATQALGAVGGTLRIESEPEQGTTARVELPSARITEASR